MRGESQKQKSVRTPCIKEDIELRYTKSPKRGEDSIRRLQIVDFSRTKKEFQQDPFYDLSIQGLIRLLFPSPLDVQTQECPRDIPFLVKKILLVLERLPSLGQNE